MNLTSPTAVRSLLEELGLEPSRALGQNFLIDRNILDILVEAAEPLAGQTVLEIGPGLGVLTEALLARAARVTAVEKDRRLYEFLRQRHAAEPRLTLIHSDFLDLDAREAAADGTAPVVSNLPYGAGSRILVELARLPMPPPRIVVTVQEEVAARLAAEAGQPERGLLGVWAQWAYSVEPIKRISPNCFWPRPEVTSTIVRLERRDAADMDAPERPQFYALTRLAFSHRRKQLATIFRREPDGGVEEATLRAADVDPRARPENLTVAEWRRLARTVLARPR